MYQIQISLKSHAPIFIKKGIKSLQQLYKALSKADTGIQICGVEGIKKVAERVSVERSQPIPLPILQKKWTVLRSPHIDKKSREQFEWTRWKEKIYFFSPERKGILTFLSFLRHSEFPGIELHFKLHCFTFFKKK